jgi:hypothetical protein
MKMGIACNSPNQGARDRARLRWRGVMALLTAAALVMPGVSEAAITFDFNFTDPAGTGWNDSTYGTTRQNTLTYAANLLGSYFDATATIGYTVTSINNPATNTLASASSDAYGPAVPGFSPTIVEYKLQSGYSGPVGYTDGSINWNFGQPWSYSLSASGVPTNKYDFVSTAMHELLHSFGFLSAIDPDGTGLLSGKSSGDPDRWYVFDKFLTTAGGANLIDTNTFAFNTSLLGTLTGGAAALRFDGTRAAVTFTNGVPIYTPTTWEQGSSGSHTDDLTFDGSAYSKLMMNAATLEGPGVRSLSTYEQAILTDIGYVVVPEPGSVVLCLTGAAAAWIFRRRRTRGNS